MEEDSNSQNHLERLCEIWFDLSGKQFNLTEKGVASVARFLLYLHPGDVYEAMVIASDKIDSSRIEERFRYFCGICWTAIKGEDAKTNMAVAK